MFFDYYIMAGILQTSLTEKLYENGHL